MEYNILQNGAINIYKHYFDDMIPTELVKPRGLRWKFNFVIINLYFMYKAYK